MKRFLTIGLFSAIVLFSGNTQLTQANELPELELMSSYLNSLDSGKYAITAREHDTNYDTLVKAKSKTDYETYQTLSEFRGKSYEVNPETLEETNALFHGHYYYDFAEDDEEGIYINIHESTTLDGTLSHIPTEDLNTWIQYTNDLNHWADEYRFIKILRSWTNDENTTVKSFQTFYSPSSTIHTFQLGDSTSDDYVMKGKIRVFNNGRQIWSISELSVPDSEYSLRYKLRYKPGSVTIESPIE